MRRSSLVLLAHISVVSLQKNTMAEEPKSALQFQAKSIDGEMVDLKQYQGKVVLIVNVRQ